MIEIVLICAAGLSTSMLMDEMKEAALGYDEQIEINAIPEGKLGGLSYVPDLILLGPQISYRLNDIKSKYEPKGCKVDVVSYADYGMMNGKAVLEKGIKTINKEGK